MTHTQHFIGDNAHIEALAACWGYFSPKQRMIVMQYLATAPTFTGFRLTCAIAGIRGYPVRALLKEFHPRYVRRFGPASLRGTAEPISAGGW